MSTSNRGQLETDGEGPCTGEVDDGDEVLPEKKGRDGDAEAPRGEGVFVAEMGGVRVWEGGEVVCLR